MAAATSVVRSYRARALSPTTIAASVDGAPSRITTVDALVPSVTGGPSSGVMVSEEAVTAVTWPPISASS